MLPFDATVPNKFNQVSAIEELNQPFAHSDYELKYNQDKTLLLQVSSVHQVKISLLNIQRLIAKKLQILYMVMKDLQFF